MSELTNRQKIEAAWKTAKPGARLMTVLMGIFVIVFFTIIISWLMPKSDDSEDESKTASRVTGIQGGNIQEAPKTVISETQTEQGRLIAAADEARVKFEARQGKSAIQAFVADQSEENASPFEKAQPTPQFRTPEPKPKPKANPNPPAPIAKPENKPVLSTAQVEALAAPIGSSKHNAEQQAPGTADKYSIGEVAQDPLAGLDEKTYQTMMMQRRAKVQAELRETIKTMQNERMQVSKGLVPIGKSEGNQTGGAGSGSSGLQPGNALAGGRNMSGTGTGQGSRTGEEPPPMLLQPGDYVVIASDYPVDSRTTREFVAKIRGGILDDARVRCVVTDAGDFLVPNCNEMTYKGRKSPIAAMVINPNTMNGIIDQDIDNDTMMKTIALVGANMMTAWGTNKIQQGQKVTQIPNTDTVVTENTLSDRDILLASTATSLGDLKNAAQTYYQKASVKTIPAGTAIMLVMTQPIPDWWGITEAAK